MQERNDIMSVDAMMDERYGKVGTPEREAFRKEAYAYCVGQIISDARKREKVTQQELAQRVGTNKSYISRIENGQRGAWCRYVPQNPQRPWPSL